MPSALSSFARTAAAAVLAIAVQPALAQEITITHAQGETVLEGVPETVLTFDLAALDTLDALGVEVDGVPNTSMPGYLAKYTGDEYLEIGSLFEPDYEAVNAAQPDLIIVAGRSSAAYADLAKIAPTIDLTNDWTDFEGSIKENSRILGEIFGKSDEVEALIGELDATIARAKAASADAGNALFVMTNAGEVTAFGPGSRFGWVHETAGLAPVIEDVEAATHGDAISFEFLLETNPDWLVVLDRDAALGREGAAARQVLDNELVAQTTAWQNDQVIYIDPARAYVVNGGLPAFTMMVGQIADALE